MPNLLAFVLANMDRPTRLHSITTVCKNITVRRRSYILNEIRVFGKRFYLSTQKPWPFDECITVLRREITENISYSLRQWRGVAERRYRRRILRRLQSLQRLYLHLYRIDHSCDFRALDVYVRKITNVWEIIWRCCRLPAHVCSGLCVDEGKNDVLCK